jgi:DNA repair protein RecO (recombination protein O)
VPKRYTSEAIVLHRRDLGDADRILVVLTRKYGKVTLIAKGAKKLKSKKRGFLEPFCVIKVSASCGKSMDILTDVETVSDSQQVRSSLKKVALAYYMLEVALRASYEGEQNEELFDHLSEYLEKIKKETKLRQLRDEYSAKAAVIMGFWPEGERIDNPSRALEEIFERKFNSVRVGQKIFS